MTDSPLHHSTIEYFLFDLDGTLCNTIDLIIATYTAVIREFFHKEADRELLKSHIGLPLEHCYADYVRRYGDLDAPPLATPAEHTATPVTSLGGGHGKPSFHAAIDALNKGECVSALALAAISAPLNPEDLTSPPFSPLSPLESVARQMYGRDAAKVAAAMCRRHAEVQTELWSRYVRPYPGVNAFVRALRTAGKRLAIVTSRNSSTAVKYASHCHVFDLFEELVTPEDTHFHKPTAAPALAGLARLGGEGAKAPLTLTELTALTSTDVPPSSARSVFIGDSLYDIECGAAAGMRTLFVSWGAGNESQLKTPPTAVAHTADDMFALFGLERPPAMEGDGPDTVIASPMVTSPGPYAIPSASSPVPPNAPAGTAASWASPAAAGTSATAATATATAAPSGGGAGGAAVPADPSAPPTATAAAAPTAPAAPTAGPGATEYTATAGEVAALLAKVEAAAAHV